MSFQTVAGPIVTDFPMKPKAIQDEMGEAFDLEYGRMSGKLGTELPNTGAQNQNFVLQNFVDPPTEVISDTPDTAVPIGALGDGTQIWKITHNGVDTHPIHFHLFDVQLINRVGWDGAIRRPDENELGWKETIRVSPLEDTIVALRAVAPKLPFGIPNSNRPHSPSLPIGATEGFSGIDPLTGQPISPPVTNQFFDFGWEYVWHCHILSHEEDDMMRPVKFLVATTAPAAPSPLTGNAAGNMVHLNWTDTTPPATSLGNPANEIGYKIMRSAGAGPFVQVGNALANATSFTDTVPGGAQYSYRVVAYSAAGDSAPTDTLSVNATTGTSNIYWRHSTLGADYLWYINNSAVSGDAFLPSVPDLNWQVAGIGDLNGDGSPDLIWRHATTGDLNVWFMNGAAFVSDAWLPRATSGWQIAGVGDFNKDGKGDILWYHSPSGSVNVWYMNGATITSDAWILGVADLQWRIAGVGDLNGDGSADILWRHTVSGDINGWLMNNAAFVSDVWLPRVANAQWQIAATGFYNNDGSTDIAWYNATTGDTNLWLMNGVVFSSDAWLPRAKDLAWRIVGPK